jgi:hypothetical protein
MKQKTQPELITLAEACRRVGITPATAVRLMPDYFPQATWLGQKRVVSRRHFEAWLAQKIGGERTIGCKA